MLTRIVAGYKINIVVLLLACIAIIFIYGFLLRLTNTKDVLSKDFHNSNLFSHIDGWSFTHFSFFFLLGILYPNHHLIAISAGVGWELVEEFIGSNKLMTVSDRKNYNTYWYGKSSDPIVNALGYSLGSYFAPCPDNINFSCKSRR